MYSALSQLLDAEMKHTGLLFYMACNIKGKISKCHLLIQQHIWVHWRYDSEQNPIRIEPSRCLEFNG